MSRKEKKKNKKPPQQKKPDENILKSLVGLLAYPCLLAAITFAVYANTLHGDFVHDDRVEILNNPTLMNTDNIGVAFKRPFWAFFQSDKDQYSYNYYRPLKTVFYILAIRLWGTDPFHFHIMSITFHTLVGIIVFFLANNLIKDRKFAAAAALIFVVHPAQSEAVAWIGASFTDPTFSLFYLLAFSAYLLRDKFPKAGMGLIFSEIFFFASLLTKDSAFTFIPLVALTQIFFRSPTRWKTRILHLGLFSLAFAAYLFMRFNALSALTPGSRYSWSMFRILISAPYFFERYLGLFLFPARLTAFHLVYPVKNLADSRFLISVPVLLLFISVAMVLWKKKSVLFFYLAWIPITLFPMFYIKGLKFPFFCERYLYLPMVGYALLMSHGIKYLAENLKSRSTIVMAYFCLFLIIAGYSTLTVKRNYVWKNNLIFYGDGVKSYPESFGIKKMYCIALYDFGLFPESLRCFEKYSLKYPDEPEANINLGRIYATQGSQMMSEGNLAEAERLFNLAENKFNRSFTNTRSDVDTYNNLAFIQMQKAKIYQSRSDLPRSEKAELAAIQYLEKCKLVNPEDYQGYLALGIAFLMRAQEKRQAAVQARQTGQTTEADELTSESLSMANAALSELVEAVRLAPSDIRVLDSVGKAYMETGQCRKADEAFRKALAIKEENDEVLFNRGLNYLECFKKPDQAREIFENLLKIKPDDPRALFYLKQIDSGNFAR